MDCPQSSVNSREMCKYCMTINLEDLKASQGQEHHPTYLSLRQSSLQCDLCRLIDGAVTRYVLRIKRNRRPEYFVHDSWGPVRLFAAGQFRTSWGDLRADCTDGAVEQIELWDRLGICIGPDANRRLAFGGFGAHITMVAEIGSAAETRGIRAIKKIPTLATCNGNVGRLRGLLHQCDRHHRACQAILSKRCTSRHGGIVKPKRLLDVQMVDRTMVSLVNTRSTPQYATLSYRWGKLQPFKTTKDNLAEVRAGVSINRLAQAIQDAVAICRDLNIPYLWVDALCIIQEGDGGEDFRRESEKMGLIYAYSYVTIAAATDNGSFLTMPRELYVTIPARSTRLAVPNGDLLFMQDFFDFSERFEDATYKNELSTRAWVKQERLLSRRTIHFTSRGIYFECCSLFWSEDGSYEDGLQFEGRRASTFLQTLSVAEHATSNRDVKLEFAINAWYEMVEEYCTLSLTHETDRLIALSGLASIAAMVIPGAYLSGLWEHTLSSGLFWHPASRPANRSADISHAPSWSWASISGAVRASGGVNVLAEENSRISFLCSQSRTGKPDILILRGTIAPCCVSIRPERRPQRRREDDPIPEDVDDYRFWPSEMGRFPTLSHTCDNICRFDGDRGNELEFYFLRLECSSKNHWLHCHGLVLGAAHDGSTSETLYRRVGIGWASHSLWHGPRSIIKLV